MRWMRVPRTWIASGLLLIAAGAIYLPDLGRGFIKDDFGWITGSQVNRPSDLVSFFGRALGFYRPLVTLTFAADRFLFDLDPFGYGCTNFVIFLLGAALLVWLARRLGMSAGVSIAVAALWAFNFHGVNMALLWISGRTALLLTACALGSALALLAGRRGAAAVCVLLAMLAKEEAVTLPFILGAWAWLLPEARLGSTDRPRRPSIARLWPLLAVLGLYLGLRGLTGAYLPWRAPSYYRMTLAPAVVGWNVVHYFDRSCTVALAFVVLACLAAGHRPRLTSLERRWMVAGGVWLIGGFALTVFLPVRSSLYALFPSVGAALMAGAAISTLAPALIRRLNGRLIWLALLLPFACLPVYRARNARWTALGDVSTSVLATIKATSEALAPGDGIVLLDDRTSPASLASVFGVSVEEAAGLITGRQLRVWIEPPVPNAGLAGLRPPPIESVRAVFRLRAGRLVRVSEPWR